MPTVPIEESELAALRADRARLNWLENCRIALNAHCQSSYGWEVVRSHNVNRIMVRSPWQGEMAAVDVNDAAGGDAARGRNVRDAIDAAMVAAGDPAPAPGAVRSICSICFDESLCAEEIHWLSFQADNCTSALVDFFSETEPSELDAIFGLTIPRDLLDSSSVREQENVGEIVSMLYRAGKRGFVVKVATPVPFGFSDDGKSYSTHGFGHTIFNWFYTETVDRNFVNRVLAWKNEFIARERQKEGEENEFIARERQKEGEENEFIAKERQKEGEAKAVADD